MPQPKVFIFAPADTESHKELEDAGCLLALGSANWNNPTGDTTEKLAEMASSADALAGTSIKGARISREVLQASEGLRIVAKYTVGVDEIDIDAATELGILVTHAPTEANWGGVAETTVTKLLTLLKNTRERDRHMKSGGAWRDVSLTGTHIGTRVEDGYRGVVIGLIGLGRIGGRVSKLMAPWGMRIVAYDPYVSEKRFRDLGVEQLGLDDLLKESDVVSLHVILTKETHHMIGEREFGIMKSTAILINTSRGPVVDEPALVKALQNALIGGAGLDVFETEPLPIDSPLRDLGDNVLLSPHMSSHNFGAGLTPGITWGTADILHALRGEDPEHVYNPEALPQWRERFAGRPLI